jgi:histidinol-phosphate aminotransferase
MKIILNKLIRQDIEQMEKYIPVSSINDLRKLFKNPIKLDAGENPFGASKKVKISLKNISLINFYPDPEYKEIRSCISDYTSMPIDNVIIGNGSDEIIDLLLRLILNEGDEIINCPPTFGMYVVSTELNKGKVVSVPRNSNYSVNIPKILKSITNKTKAIIICSPNNPTGNITNNNNIEVLLKTKKLIIVDEAYFEFCNKTCIRLIKKYNNLVILRTFSKWAGIAGLRIGYGIMDKFLTEQIMKIKPPYNVNRAAEVTAIAALNDLKSYIKIINKINEEKKEMIYKLKKLPYLTAYNTDTNFLYLKIKNNFAKLKEFLGINEIIVRYYESKLTGNAIRLTIGTPKQNIRILNYFQKFNSSLSEFDSVIFDMDGVLVDVSNSYRQAIKNTVEYVLKNAYQINLVVKPQDIESIKKIPGFNNDWDLSYELIRLLSNKTSKNDFKKYINKINRNDKDYKKIKKIFQSYYLGEKLYWEIYKEMPPLNIKNGLINNESSLIQKEILENIYQNYKIGVATSRPRFEAIYTLKKLGITPNFILEKNIVAQEDTQNEKPAPDPLLETKKRLNKINPVYVGDSINDILAAKSANMKCIFIGKNKLADFEIPNVNKIGKLLCYNYFNK